MSSQPACRLLSLPSELRNAIYEQVLVQHSDRVQRRPRGDSCYGTEKFFCANVLRTCKQIHVEATPILYGENVFLAHPNLLSALPQLLLASQPTRVPLPPVVHPRVAKLIRRYFIHVRLDTDPRFTAAQATESFSRVEQLEVEVFQASYGTCDFTVLKLFEGVRGVGQARVHGSVGDGNYARWLEAAMTSPLGAEVETFSEQYVGGDKAWDAWTNGNR